ncbi:ABC transporter ATP-binding protein [Lactiplantibacillus plantarum subsp. plantarum]|nr:ABC transporter ATP-binding protein [Lactiplantibacillus plantarum subsp. plantarum]
MIYTGSVEQLLAQHPQQSLEAIYLQMAGRLTDDHLVDALEGEHDA